MSDGALVDTIRAELRAAADPARAPEMQRYMKSGMPYLGVRVPQVRAIVRCTARENPPDNGAELVDGVRALWSGADYREERYAATALLDVPAVRRFRSPALITLHAELITDGAWWDHVDEVSHRVGELLQTYPDEIEPVVREWQHAPDMWLRRASIICQVGARESTDTDLLRDAILASADQRNFFLRKAIGWALRDYARTDPGWVRAFVAQHELSPLSRREALKHL